MMLPGITEAIRTLAEDWSQDIMRKIVQKTCGLPVVQVGGDWIGQSICTEIQIVIRNSILFQQVLKYLSEPNGGFLWILDDETLAS